MGVGNTATVTDLSFDLDIHKIIFISAIPCTTNSDCPDYLACGEEEECVETCSPKCTVNAHCEASNHVGICTCNSGYEGCKIGK